MTQRLYSLADRLITQFDQGLRTLTRRAPSAGRPGPVPGSDSGPVSDPAAGDAALSDDRRRLSARLMRVNHTGEVCAQALYQGQCLTARQPALYDMLRRAALEEGDHLRWCEQRLDELGGRTSVLNPAFYAGAFTLGALAGAAGDRWSLGFLDETEQQVERHLDRHLERIAPEDRRSRAVLAQMREDERHHAASAREAGAARLPLPLRLAMRAGSKLMTGPTYWV